MSFLDLKNVNCPLTTLTLKSHMKKLAPGTVVDIEATDKTTLVDIPAFCQTTGNKLIGEPQTVLVPQKRGDVTLYRFKVEKA